jgi:hypothetical protein
MSDLRYPVGPFTAPGQYTPELRASFIGEIEALPAHMRAAVAGLTVEQLRTPYREGGWTVAQVVHHVGDSHINAYVRIKLALTEDNTPVKAYDEKKWAELPDATGIDPRVSLDLLTSLHARWTVLLKSLKAADFSRTFQHSEMGLVVLDRVVAMYAWHSRHHVAHITSLRQRMGW